MAVAITQTANPAGISAISGNVTYSGASTGTASADRIVFLLIGCELSTAVPESVTIDGNAMALADGTTFTDMGAWIYWKEWPSGTTADFFIDWFQSPTSTQNHVAVYAVTGATTTFTTGNDTSTDMDSNDPLTTGSTTIPTDGGMLAVAVGASDGQNKTWANLTEDIDADVGGFKFTTATSLTPGTATRTCTGGANAEDGVLAWIIFSPSETGQPAAKRMGGVEFAGSYRSPFKMWRNLLIPQRGLVYG